MLSNQEKLQSVTLWLLHLLSCLFHYAAQAAASCLHPHVVHGSSLEFRQLRITYESYQTDWQWRWIGSVDGSEFWCYNVAISHLKTVFDCACVLLSFLPRLSLEMLSGFWDCMLKLLKGCSMIWWRGLGCIGYPQVLVTLPHACWYKHCSILVYNWTYSGLWWAARQGWKSLTCSVHLLLEAVLLG